MGFFNRFALGELRLNRIETGIEKHAIGKWVYRQTTPQPSLRLL